MSDFEDTQYTGAAGNGTNYAQKGGSYFVFEPCEWGNASLVEVVKTKKNFTYDEKTGVCAGTDADIKNFENVRLHLGMALEETHYENALNSTKQNSQDKLTANSYLKERYEKVRKTNADIIINLLRQLSKLFWITDVVDMKAHATLVPRMWGLNLRKTLNLLTPITKEQMRVSYVALNIVAPKSIALGVMEHEQELKELKNKQNVETLNKIEKKNKKKLGN